MTRRPTSSGPSRPGPRAGAELGQTTAELAVVFPVVLLLILTLIQAALVFRDDLALVNAAREAARAASLDPDPARAERAAAAVLPGTTVRSDPRPAVGELVRVRVSYRSATTLPLVGPLLPDPVLVAGAAMRVER
jgi:Flp pilus assembly protein TadG